MASAERFSIYTSTLNNATHMTQLDGWTANPNVRRGTIIPGGDIDVAHIGVSKAAPTVTFRTRDLAGALGAVDIATGLDCTAATTFRFQERVAQGTFEAAATLTHTTISAAKGFAQCTSISADEESEDGATGEFTFHALWDGSTNPLVNNDGVAITSSVPAFASRFYLGPVYHGGSEINGISNVTVEPGINFVARTFNNAYPKLGAIVSRTPQIRFTFAKVDELPTSLFGNAISTGVVVYLRKGVASDTRVADGTAQHIKITCSAGDWAVDDTGAQGNDDGSVTVVATPTAALTFSSSSAIP